MTPEPVADATAELIARIALLLDRRNAVAVAEFQPIVGIRGAQRGPRASRDRVSLTTKRVHA